MGKLFKLGTAGMTERAKQRAKGSWYTKVRIADYRYKRVRLCSDAGTSETWARLLQHGVDRFRSNEPVDLEKLRDLMGGHSV